MTKTIMMVTVVKTKTTLIMTTINGISSMKMIIITSYNFWQEPS